LVVIALTLLIQHQEEHPVHKNWMFRCWHGCLSGASCKWFTYGSADITATQSSFALLESSMVYLLVSSYPDCHRKETIMWVFVSIVCFSQHTVSKANAVVYGLWSTLHHASSLTRDFTHSEDRCKLLCASNARGWSSQKGVTGGRQQIWRPVSRVDQSANWHIGKFTR